VDHDEIVISETLQGREGAVGAIIFSCFTLLVLAGTVVEPNGFRRMGPIGLAIPGGLALSELTVMLLVIHQTWRRTLLTVRFEEMLLAFSSPMYRKRYRWTGNDIADMLLVQTANNDTPRALAELCITRCVGGEIHLFTDHPLPEIKSLLELLPPMFREGRGVPMNPVAVVPTPEVPPIDPWTGAVKTSGSLVEFHREMRKRGKQE
jgi:hypothetical protein